MRPPAKGSITEYGYRRIRLPGSRKLWMEHVVVWERHHGPVPKGMEVHHINGDKLDNRIENLHLVSRLTHKRIHSDCYRFNGRWFKRCRRCRWYRSVDEEFYVYPGGKGAMSICKRCAIELAVMYEKRRRERRKTAAANAGGNVTERTPAALAGVGEEGI